MVNYDSNKRRRDFERRVLKNAGWVAVSALKDNDAFQWKWIHHTRKKAYSREQAFAKAKRDLQRVR